MDVVIRHLFISPGHNFFGHHGRPAGEHPTLEVKEIMCRAGHGVEGDRYFDYKENYAGQITFFSWDIYEATKEKFAEMRYLETSIGKTGLRAIQPMLHMSQKDLWQLYMLGK